MRILVTGGCGFLGHHVVEHLLKNTSADIVVLDKLSYASAGFDRLRDIQCFDSGRVKVIGCDLARPIPEGVVKEIDGADYVIHAAAETHVDNSIMDPLPFLESNVLGTHHLLMFCRSLPGLKRVFLVSTDEVYGPATWDSPGNVESDPFRPANPYAAAKAGGEAVGMAYANTYRIPVTIVNTMNLYGQRQGAEKFILLCVRKVLNGETIHIHADPEKTRSGTRFYIHCRNYASALLFLLEGDRDLGPNRIPLKVHVAGEKEVSNLDLAQTIAGIVGKPLNYELVDFHSSRPGHDLRYALDDSLIRSMGWEQPVDFEKSLRETVEWHLRPENARWMEVGVKPDRRKNK